MLVRDDHGIIVQHDPNNPSYKDGGDSACRTGLLALCGSAQDAALLPLFESNGVMVRHPYQEPWNNWKNCTRDQLIPYVAGLWATGLKDTAQRLYDAHSARGFRCQNTEKDYPGTTKKFPDGPDILAFDHQLHLRLCRGSNEWRNFIGYSNLWASITWSTKVKPNEEQNQIICQCLVAGSKYVKSYRSMHPDYKGNLRAYWGGWRDQIEIAEMIIAKVDSF
jgi:hypothetical protein